MKLNYVLTLADWKAAIRLHMRQKLSRRIHLFIYQFIFPALAVLFLVVTLVGYLNGQDNLVSDLIMPDTALAGIAILLPIVRSYRIRKSFKEMFSFSQSGPGYSLDIDDERILSVRPGVGEATYLWSGIRALAQDKRIILIYISEILFLGIPTSTLSPEQRTELNELVARHGVKRKP